mgnify:FL=1
MRGPAPVVQGGLELMIDEARTLGDALPAEMARVRDEVLPSYLSLRGMPGVNAEFAIRGMQADLDAAAKAMAEGDTVAMLRVYQSLKEWHT